MNIRRLPLIVSVLLLMAGVAPADDGILYYYGSPVLMHGESTIRMVRELVRIKVSASRARVYCRFVFHNEGPATIARIGFPDGDDHEGEEGTTKPWTSLKNFRSKVDGKSVAVKTELVPDWHSQDIQFFHTKKVRFARGQTRIVEDWYTGRLSGGGTTNIIQGRKGEEGLYVSQVRYIMASGGSWKGNIGKATVQVDFEEPKFKHLRLVPQAQTGEPMESTILSKLKPNRVIWAGFSRPHASGNRVTFVRSNFKPTKRDDIELSFDLVPYDESQDHR